MPEAAEPWSLTSLREKLIKIGARVVSHGRYVTFQLAEVAVPSRARFDRPLLAPGVICRCPGRSKVRCCPRNPGDLANVGSKRRTPQAFPTPCARWSSFSVETIPDRPAV